MTDRDLLELAAKAAGYEPQGMEAGKLYLLGIQDGWNPLTDDGDALRLAVTLGLVVCVMNEPGFTGVYLPAERIGGKYDEVEHHGNDPYAATRRAITRAAASIGRGES